MSKILQLFYDDPPLTLLLIDTIALHAEVDRDEQAMNSETRVNWILPGWIYAFKVLGVGIDKPF